MKSRLIYKLLAINLVVIGFVMAVVWLSIDTLAAGYFVELMDKYHISPEPAHDMFVSAVHRYLIWACLAAVVLAALLSFWMLRRALTPLTSMTVTTREIAAGEFSSRVVAKSNDEVGQLARAFNRMAESLEKIEKLRRTLMIDIAHELRTPLTNIRGYLEALDDKLVPPSQQTFDLLQSETQRLAQLVEDVLQLARADAAQGHLNREPIDIRAMLDKTLETFLPGISRKSIQLAIEDGSGTSSLSADPARIARVLRNLVDNAVRYTPEQGKLEIRITHDSDSLKLVFINDTNEIVPEDPTFLFERFYRGEQSRSRELGGAGIGLAIVKELVMAHGGAVGAEPIDGRLRIWFSLPLDAVAV
ncbi:MAG: ATP-binding protein [Desulfobacteraceae bacterium]